MKKVAIFVVLAIVLLVSFALGNWYNARAMKLSAAEAGPKVLYYVDPMHPSYKSEKPGIAPDCGMQLEPVYADGSSAGPTLSPGTVLISAERQQTIGVRVATVEKAPAMHVARVLGRVAADENRVYPLLASTEGWIRGTVGGRTGSIVRKDEVLAHYYSPNLLTPQSTYFYALSAADSYMNSPNQSLQQGSVNANQIRSAEDVLRSLGMTDHQMREIATTRKAAKEIEIRSPVTGLVLTRNIAPELRFVPGTEFYRIVDLSRVWILADIFENEAQYYRPGVKVRARLQQDGRRFSAFVSQDPPQFDPATRTLKVRLEADNPGFVLRPGMFVDVELPVSLPPAITVPVDAVLDSGLKKTVFVMVRDGVFEPRKVETGWRHGDRVQIVSGLDEGDKIVTSGTFLVDSESRMKAAAAGIYGDAVKDPVCGMDIDEAKARAAGKYVEHRGKSYFFCSDQCKRDFANSPAKFTKDSSTLMASTKPALPPEHRGATHANHDQAGKQQAPPPDEHQHNSGRTEEARAVDPICGMEVEPASAAKSGLVSEYAGGKFHFCRTECKRKFDSDPAKYASQSEGPNAGDRRDQSHH